MYKKISVLGSTGSIGQNTLEVAAESPNRFKIVGMAAGRNYKLFSDQIQKFNPEIVSFERKIDADRFRAGFRSSTLKVCYGIKGAEEVAAFDGCDVVVSAITGINGLKPTMAALESGKTVALANKESLVVGGSLIQKILDTTKAKIIPVDSEHSGVFQCLAKEDLKNVRRVTLTASGGPFLKTPKDELKNKTLKEALDHPRWEMGKKVTIDSATMMNKGLELIEARWLFRLDPSQLDILVHPQSIVHSLVEMKDGSVLAQLSPTDMKIPIQYALTYPERGDSPLPSLDLNQAGPLEFFPVDEGKFPLVRLARRVLRRGESYAVVLNAANEVAVEAFIHKKISYNDISAIVTEIVNRHQKTGVEEVEDILNIDRETRMETLKQLEKRK